MTEPTSPQPKQPDLQQQVSPVEEAGTPNTPEIKQGEQVSFSFGFDKGRLGELDPSDLVSEDDWDYESKVTRVRSIIDLFQRLPESMHIEPGITAIFGDNGQGKTLLADTVVMALRMEQFRAKYGIPSGDKVLGLDVTNAEGARTHFVPIVPGILQSSPHTDMKKEEAHATFVARLAECINVRDVVLHDPDSAVGNAMRTPAALGDVAMGMSSRQAVDLMESIGKGRKNPSVKIYDEPELGMSPRRHQELLPLLEQRVTDGSVELVPSNSILLYESAIPRIDLETPELGIIRPQTA